jgi:phosphoribosylanthranilate isomerase
VRLFDSGCVGVKICGITNEADAAMCIDAGAAALGFNFYSGSKRFIEPDKCLDWIGKIEGAVDRVAVVVNAESDLLSKIRDSGCFEFVQFHGDETPAHCISSGGKHWIRAVRVKDNSALESALDYFTPHLLLDAWSPVAYGGTGDVADWKMLRDFVARNSARKFVLAGGLTPQNVAEAIRVVSPSAVDVAGGVESEPRRKDAILVRQFIAAAACALNSKGVSP